MSISKETEQVIIGGLLGDSYIRQREKNCMLQMQHGPAQEEYIRWKFSFLEKDGLNTPKGVFRIIVNSFGKQYPSFMCYTKQHYSLNPYRHLFYDGKKKIVTRNILNKLTPLGLAIWYMDDGSRNLQYRVNKQGVRYIGSRVLKICSDSFTYQEHLIIQQYFSVVWGIDMRIEKRNVGKPNESYRCAFNAVNSNKLIPIIKPYIIPCLEYKIDLKYNAAVPSGDMIYSELDSDIQNSAEMTESLDENEVI